MPTPRTTTASALRQTPEQTPAGSAAVPPGSGLVYVSDDMPGLSRRKTGTGFRYLDTQGKPLTDADEIERINQLAIPPAYERVWICPQRNGHLQATGYDARGRKQYRYHADWQSRRNDSKFERLQAFGQALPRIRARVARDLVPHKKQPLSRPLVLATLVRLLDTTYVRVGNDAYARDNGSFGLTTLRTPHAGVRGSTLRLRFRGKSGVMQDLKVDDPKVAQVVRRCQQLPGQLLFQYEDENGALHSVDSSDVNDYLAQIARGRNEKNGKNGKSGASNERFTAKDFRTWHGTVQALELTRLACKNPEAAGYNAKELLKEVARQLGNTPAVCKKSYIHPAVMALGSELSSDPAAMIDIWNQLAQGATTRRLQAGEARLLAFLQVHQRRTQRLQAKVQAHAKTKTPRQAKATVNAKNLSSRQTTPKKTAHAVQKAGCKLKPASASHSRTEQRA